MKAMGRRAKCTTVAGLVEDIRLPAHMGRIEATHFVRSGAAAEKYTPANSAVINLINFSTFLSREPQTSEQRRVAIVNTACFQGISDGCIKLATPCSGG